MNKGFRTTSVALVYCAVGHVERVLEVVRGVTELKLVGIQDLNPAVVFTKPSLAGECVAGGPKRAAQH